MQRQRRSDYDRSAAVAAPASALEAEPEALDAGAAARGQSGEIHRSLAQSEGTVGSSGGLATPAVQRALGGSSGAPLAAGVRGALERTYQADLSGVRVHTGGASADAARSIQAKAFTHGQDVHFAPGHYAPQSPAGFGLIAHEVAHTVQAGGLGGVQAKLEVAPSDAPAEREADAAAASAARGEGFRITRASGSVGRAIHRVDQREGTAIPDASTQSAIAGELYPGSTSSGGAPVPWDGRTGAAGAVAARAAMIAEMHAAMSAWLVAEMPSIQTTAAQPRVAITSLEGAGQAAKADADRRFSAWATGAALTSTQSTARASYAISASGGGKNLFDAQDAGERTAAGQGVNPEDLASWIAETAPAGQSSIQGHHFPTGSIYGPPSDEQTYWWDNVIEPWATANDADLRLYDLHGFAMSDPDTGRIVLPTAMPTGMSTTSPGGGEPSPAERALRWSSWRTMIHEYIHQLEHPALHNWPGSNRTIGEGFCELFTKEVLLPLLPSAGGTDVGRRTQVEGGDWGAPSASLMGGAYNAGSYADYLQRAENIQGHLGGASVGARNAMKAIFFQGHVELLGYDTAGSPLTAPGRADTIMVPVGTGTVEDLARITGSTADIIRMANPGLVAPVVGLVTIPGCREHVVVVATDSGGGSQAETLRVIARQNDVSETALQRANPGVDFTALSAGQRIIIPVH